MILPPDAYTPEDQEPVSSQDKARRHAVVSLGVSLLLVWVGGYISWGGLPMLFGLIGFCCCFLRNGKVRVSGGILFQVSMAYYLFCILVWPYIR